MQNYGKLQARDRGEEIYVGIALPFPALASTNIENSSASSVTSLNANTTVLEVTAVTAPVAIRWSSATTTTSVITAAGTANFDNIIPAGQLRQFIVPRNTQGLSSGYSSIVGLNVQEGLYSGIATKTAGAVGSVLLTQY